MPVSSIAFAALFVIFAYSILRRRLLVLSQPIRCDLARRGERIVANPILPEKCRKEVQLYLDNAFHPCKGLVVWAVALFLLPLSVFLFLVPKAGRDYAELIQQDDLKREFRLVRGLAILSDMALSPIGATLIIVQVPIFLMLFVPLNKLVSVIERSIASVFLGSSANLKQTAN